MKKLTQDIKNYFKKIEKILINEREIETVRVICDELQLTLNLSVKDNFQPIKIHKMNGKTAFTMTLIGFET